MAERQTMPPGGVGKLPTNARRRRRTEEGIERAKRLGKKAGQKRKIAELYASGKTMAELAEEYGVGVGTIWRSLQPETKEAA
jgi:DNA invertase Pin-like site-specific DNA recombinase